VNDKGNIRIEKNNKIKSPNVIIRNTHQPGILFEKAYDMRIIQGDWRISCFLDTVWEKFRLSTLDRRARHLEEVYRTNRNAEIYSFYVIAIKFNDTYESFKKIDEELKFLSGTLPTPELEYYQNQIDYLHRNRKYVILEKKQRTFVESSVSRPSEHEERRWDDLHDGLKRVEDFVRKGENKMENEKLVRNILFALGEELDEYLAKSRTMLKIVDALKGNRSFHDILSLEDLREIKKDAEQQKDVRFAFDIDTLSMKNILKSSRTEFGVFSRKVMLNIYVPLVKSRSSTIYHMQSLPTPLTNTTVLYVKPRTNYIITSTEGYYYVQKPELDQCTIIESIVICKNEWFHYSKEPNCEYDLLTNNKSINYENCNIIYKQQNSTSFFRTLLGNQWVFTTPRKIEIMINYGLRYSRIIQGTGTIKFNPQCRIEVGKKILTLEKETSHEDNVIIPNQNLVLNNLTSLSKDTETLQQLLSLLNQGTEEKRFWEVERLAKQDEENKREQRKANNIIIVLAVIIGVLVLGVVSILSFLCYFKKILAETPDVIELSVQIETSNLTDPNHKKAFLRFV
jgi:hypothetical protein